MKHFSFPLLLMTILFAMTACGEKKGDATISWTVTANGDITSELSAIQHIYDSVFTSSDAVEKSSGSSAIVRNATSMPRTIVNALALQADQCVKDHVKLSHNSSYTAQVKVVWCSTEDITNTFKYEGQKGKFYNESDITKFTGAYTCDYDGGIAQYVDCYFLYTDLATGKLDSVLLTPKVPTQLSSEGTSMKYFLSGYSMVKKAGVETVTEDMDRDYTIVGDYKITAEFNDGNTKVVLNPSIPLGSGAVLSGARLNKLNSTGIFRHTYGNYELVWDYDSQYFVRNMSE